MQGNRELLKLKIKDSDVFLKYRKPEEDSAYPETITIESSEPPKQELRAALQQMVEHVIDIAELPVAWRDELTVVGVTVTRNDVEGLVITALRDLDGSNSPLVLNTPHFTREERDENQETNVYSYECACDLDELERLAFEYADGDRGQRTFDFVDSENFVGAEATS